ncbi:hypothetical protein OROMI_004343 [Orobanche minor]
MVVPIVIRRVTSRGTVFSVLGISKNSLRKGFAKEFATCINVWNNSKRKGDPLSIDDEDLDFLVSHVHGLRPFWGDHRPWWELREKCVGPFGIRPQSPRADFGLFSALGWRRV